MCRSLFEKDKLLFAFLMTVHLKAHVQHALDWASLRFLLTGARINQQMVLTCPQLRVDVNIHRIQGMHTCISCRRLVLSYA